ncbi:hypothetical protein [Aeromonas caviae]|uniref:hypothetical protein n=1 Tax=Aeromonas caviae TaxID=648 RepID=UPI003F742589
MINIAVLGASNSIVGGGWHSRLRRSDVNLKCFAVGGSNSGIGIYKLVQESVLNWADLVIINFGVTEHEELKFGYISEEHLYLLISNLYRMISASGLPMISLSLPIIAGIEDLNNDVSYKIHKACAIETSSLFIDGYQFTKEIIQKSNGLPASFFFLDQHHLAPWVAKHIGMVIAEIVNDFVTLPKNTPKSYTLKKFDILDANTIADLNNLETVTRGTSLLKETTAILSKNDTIGFTRAASLHGLYVDCGISSAKLTITSINKRVIKNYFCASQNAKKDSVQFKFCTFHSPVGVDKSSTISIAAHDAIVNESNRMEREPIDPNGQAYICGILLSYESNSVTCYVRDTSKLATIVVDRLAIRANDCADITRFKYIDSGLIDLVNVCESSHASIGDYIYYLRDMFANLGLDKANKALTAFIEKNAIIKNFKSDYQIIAESDFFDRDFYLNTYPDVHNAGVDPVSHYINHGCAEGRVPSNKIHMYPEIHSDSSRDINKVISLLRNTEKMK